MPVEGVEHEPDPTANRTRAAMLADPVVRKRMRANERFGAALESGDRDGALALFSPAYSRVDRRSGPREDPNLTTEQYVDSLLVGFEVGFQHVTCELLDHVGRHLLGVWTFSSDSGFEILLLAVQEFEDDDCHVRRSVHFDVEDRASADAYLRHAEADDPSRGDGTPHV